MKKFLKAAVAAIAVTTPLAFFAAEPVADPVADPAAVVRCGNARFTVLTPGLVRMEWNADGKFVDDKSLMVVNRRLEVPKYKVKTSKNGVTITTDAMQLRYVNDGRPMDAKNVSVTFPLKGRKTVWAPGMVDTLNLMGTARTLDRADGSKLGKAKMETGVLSRSGWTLLDDSRNQLLEPVDSHWKEWVTVRPDTTAQDWYFMAYGHDYKTALADYQAIAGRAPMPPKATFGYWWSRYWQYSDDELVDIVDKLRSYDIPIDVLIVDMDWHDTFGLTKNNPRRDEYGERIGWTGYTWQAELFPNPKNFLEWAHRENLLTALNLHPASGIQPYEQCYEAFVNEYGKPENGGSVPFKMDEQRWADAYFNTVLGPMEHDGVDFWWLDWQQWVDSKYTPGLSNTFWLNHTFYNHARENGANRRPFIYHRWGGLGSHRYPLGFSGDTYATWASLAFQPWFTATASNVNYGYWGHDIGGHLFHSKVKDTDPELYLRWLQYGVFTPIFKTHSTKDRRIVRYPWAFPDHQFMMRDAIRLRYTLVPYIYNASRHNYDTGVAMCRPMYYEYPEVDKAYNVPEQYLFGNDIIATAVACPVDTVTGLATRTVWLPEGQWYDCATGAMLNAGDHTLQYTVGENPWYVRAGAIIPMNPSNISSLQVPCDTLVLTFYPGANGNLKHYEDDGVTEQYTDRYATTEVTKTANDTRTEVLIKARQGSYDGARDSRAYELRFPATYPPKAVTVNGVSYPYARFATPGTWTYDAMTLQPVIYTTMLPVDADVAVTLDTDAADASRLYGKAGIFSRCRVLTPEFKEEQCLNGESYIMLPESYLKVSQCPNFILEDPKNISAYLDAFDAAIEALPATLAEYPHIGDRFRLRVNAQLAR